MATLTKADAARQLGIARSTLYKLIDQGVLSATSNELIDSSELVRVAPVVDTLTHRPRTTADSGHQRPRTSADIGSRTAADVRGHPVADVRGHASGHPPRPAPGPRRKPRNGSVRQPRPVIARTRSTLPSSPPCWTRHIKRPT